MSGSGLVDWYNTRCPVCDAGIDWQRNKLLAAVRAGKISFHDINEQPKALAAHGASLGDIRRRLHATDESGRLIVGADVMIAIWRPTPGEGWMASLFGNPVILPVTRFAYDRFADVLFAWNKRKGHWWGWRLRGSGLDAEVEGVTRGRPIESKVYGRMSGQASLWVVAC